MPASWHDAAVRRALVLVITFATGLAVAHVGPSKDDNNRYLKLTLSGDRVRFAYTVFFGEIPGLQARSSIDADRDGTISEAEAQAYGNKVAAEVAAALDVSVDKRQLKLQWAEVVVGMGSPSARAGAFSVDLITQLCFAPAGQHQLLIRDRFKLLHPGETEIKIEKGFPGIHIVTAKVGAESNNGYQWKLVGPSGPLADDGIDLVFEVGDKAPPASSACSDGPPPVAEEQRSMPAWIVIGAAAIVAFILATVVTLIRRKKR
jgi:hypothetical protein